jgi:acetylornithine/succinyldiaminopimelate/putrescine aminotransferase
VGEGLTLGEHGSTFAGGPIGARAALAALDVLSDQNLLAAVREHEVALRETLGQVDGVAEVRGRGLMIGVGLAEGIDAREVAGAALADGLVVNAPNPETIRLLPALTIGADELAQGLSQLGAAISLAAGARP